MGCTAVIFVSLAWLGGGVEGGGNLCAPGAVNMHYSAYKYLNALALSKLSPWAHLHVVGMLRFMSNINQPSLPTPFYSVLVSVSVILALSSVFRSVYSPDNSPLSHSVLPVLYLPYWSFQLYYLRMKVSFGPDIIPSD